MKNNRLFVITIALLFIFITLAIFSYISKEFGEANAIDLLFICNFMFLCFSMIKNGIKIADFKWWKIKQGNFKYGGVAFFYFIVNGIVWSIILYCRS